MRWRAGYFGLRVPDLRTENPVSVVRFRPGHHELREILEDASAPCRRPHRRIRATTAARWWRPSSALSARRCRSPNPAPLEAYLPVLPAAGGSNVAGLTRPS